MANAMQPQHCKCPSRPAFHGLIFRQSWMFSNSHSNKPSGKFNNSNRLYFKFSNTSQLSSSSHSLRQCHDPLYQVVPKLTFESIGFKICEQVIKPLLTIWNMGSGGMMTFCEELSQSVAAMGWIMGIGNILTIPVPQGAGAPPTDHLLLI